MSKAPIALPVARTWRDIPQQVRPRAMSKEGKRRVFMRFLRIGGGVAIVGLAAAATWEVNAVLHPAAGASPLPPPRGERIGDNLVPLTDGVLDKAWVRQTLHLPAEATLASVDLEQMRVLLAAHGQVASASVVRHYPNTLEIRLTERMPVARIHIEDRPGRTFLVARDGVVYEGIGYDSKLVDTLPWLDGFSLVAKGGGFAPIPGMETVADFLSRSRLEAEALYRSWRVVSLARLDSDGLIEVRTDAGLKVIFGTQGDDVFRQLARLDLLMDTVVKKQPANTVREINLSLGSQVPVAVDGDGLLPPAGRPPSSAKHPLRIQLSL